MFYVWILREKDRQKENLLFFKMKIFTLETFLAMLFEIQIEIGTLDFLLPNATGLLIDINQIRYLKC